MFESILKDATSSNKLIIGNPEGNVGIVTLWSKLKDMAAKVPADRYCIMGQLFSAERGLDLLVRNLLANPQITNLVVTGVDFSKSGIVLEDFFRQGFDRGETKLTKKPVWKVKSAYEGYVELDIPEEVLEELRRSVSVVRVPNIAVFDFSTLQAPSGSRVRRVYEKQEEQVKHYIGETTGHVIRGKTIAEVWLKVLDSILKFGKESATHYGNAQRELVNVLSIIEEEDPKNFFLPSYLPCDESRVKAYIPRITRDLPGGIHKNEYTYGSRMRSWFGTDQVKRAVDKLVREPISRAVVISLWDATKDLEIGGSPCLNHIWLRITEDRLAMTCVFRSHDMFEGYPENAFGLRTLQEEIRSELQERLGKPVHLGELMILSQSAHLYKDTWEWAAKVSEQQLPSFQRHLAHLDPRGNFIISREGEEIVMMHTGLGGEKIGEFRGKSGFELMQALVKENVVSSVNHALDLGLELMKAEIAGKLGIEYKQDQPLELLPEKEESPAPFQQTPVKEGPVPSQEIQINATPAPVQRAVKEGIVQTDHQRRLYPKILSEAKIDSFGL